MQPELVIAVDSIEGKNVRAHVIPQHAPTPHRIGMEAAIDMDPLERHSVGASRPRSGYIALSPLDIYLGHFITGGVYYFLRTPDIGRMTQALAVAIDRHPAFGATMVREANTLGLRYGESGAEFAVRRSAAPCPDLWSAPSLVTDALMQDDGEPPVDAETSDNYSFNRGSPVVRLRLVLFRDRGCALVVRHVHSLGDGATLVGFLRNWSRIYHGLPPSAPGDYSRSAIASLAHEAPEPSRRLNVRPRTAQHHSASTAPPREGGSVRIDIAEAMLTYFLQNCRLRSTLSLSSSDIIHALAWKCFALTQPAADDRLLRLYTLFDLRSVGALGIPVDYEGSAILGRWAEATYGDLRNRATAYLAALFRQQTKPVTVDDVRQDIGYLAYEYSNGHIDADGNYSRFTIGAWSDCRTASGLIVNDLRRLGTDDIRFDESPARIETLVSPEINMVSIYRNDDGTVTLHYVGEKSTLSAFSSQVRQLLRIAPGTHSPARRR